ncbi:MAG: hypothetical protein KatS3mg110_1452 [Pirellulaceae bacterium]|nr:MAG: hypothetical protein KatS3mg110_1452 [Pirellulaceae bacterium]
MIEGLWSDAVFGTRRRRSASTGLLLTLACIGIAIIRTCPIHMMPAPTQTRRREQAATDVIVQEMVAKMTAIADHDKVVTDFGLQARRTTRGRRWLRIKNVLESQFLIQWVSD